MPSAAKTEGHRRRGLYSGTPRMFSVQGLRKKESRRQSGGPWGVDTGAQGRMTGASKNNPRVMRTKKKKRHNIVNQL